MGILQIASSAVCGSVMATFEPSTPPTFPTAENVFHGAKDTHSDMVCCVPAFVEQWATEPAKVEHLKTLKGVIFGGAPLLKDVGDRLASEGVCLYSLYGSTELGIMAPYFPANPGLDWDWVTISKQMRPVFVPYGDGTFELVMTVHGNWRPAIVDTTIDGREAYATKDLFIPHPNKPGMWKLYGRADDQIMLSTGEKTNPVPLERILVQDPHIQAAVIFGTGKLQNGVVIDPKKEHGFDTHDVTGVERFKEMIWPTIERLNAFAPQHSRIFKETIIFSSPDKPFTYTGKGTARRQAIINEYQPEIEAMFEAIAISSHSEVDLPSSWSKTETLRFIRNVVHTVLERDIADDADIFQFGGDSLQASWIYNQVACALRETSGETSPCSNLKSNCVYQAPSIALLSRLIYDLVNPTFEDEAETKYTETQRLHDLVSHYTSDFPARPETLRESIATKDAVLVTGTTGGLGCHILMHLLSDSSVGTVYALNRPSATFERQVQAFQSNGLDADCLNLPKLRFIRGDLCEKSFGLEASVFEEIRDSVTHIIHNAWKVDFNHSVTSFLSLLGGMRALVDLCLASPYVQPPRLLFTSSVGVFRQYDGPTYALEEPIEDPSVVAGTGYSESKWIGERILAAASEKAGLCAASVRVGQICGGVNGNWNEREWFPSVVKSAQYVGCLPDVEGDVSWIPSYNAALALVQMRTSDESILHLAHPRPVAWRTFMQAIAQRMRVPLVPYSAWLAALEQSQRDSQLSDLGKLNHNPALRLLDFFREVEATAEKEPLGCIHMATSKAELAAPALGLPELGLEWVERWMHVWQESGFIDTPQDA
ncbi:hypothetical protein EW026_g4198 [Hermanssonia centrifuga]|uniref:Uncharacterized protein n=1 Tax=Hermanssonia centrifuga TaxID=98765 RepID=A0A4S4KHV2_9APHY|nr:hypothetical protein EW026_g4198 [Hermanssonia centrifuga]